MSFEGFTSKLSVSTSTTFTAGLEFISETLAERVSANIGAGLRGTRSRISGRTREGVKTVGGTIQLEPSPEELATLLPWILGANASGTTYALSDTLTDRYIAKLIDSSVGWMQYTGCKVNRATFEASSGGPLTLSLDIVAKSEAKQGTTYPTLTYNETTPFMFYDSDSGFDVVNSSGTLSDLPISRFSVTIDNFLAPKFYNSQTATTIPTRDRLVTFAAVLENTSTSFNGFYGISGEHSITMTFTYGGYSMVFAMPYCRLNRETPTINGRDEVAYGISGTACKSSTTNELTVTLDSTP